VKKITLLAVFLLAGCASPPKTFQMSEVLKSCVISEIPYLQVIQCIKETYSRIGNNPSAISVKSFYAQLDADAEAFQSKLLTDKQARAQIYKNYSDTIELSNARNPPNQTRVCLPINGMIVCQ
jgi:hypothetical protein